MMSVLEPRVGGLCSSRMMVGASIHLLQFGVFRVLMLEVR